MWRWSVARQHSKEHVYVCLERGSRKIRRIVVRDKSSDALSVFAKHLKPNTEMCVDPGTENTYFDNLSAVIELHKIPGPIHVDPFYFYENLLTFTVYSVSVVHNP